jgi:hypothetical protein
MTGSGLLLIDDRGDVADLSNLVVGRHVHRLPHLPRGH